MLVLRSPSILRPALLVLGWAVLSVPEAAGFENFAHPVTSRLQCRTACHQPQNLKQAREDKTSRPECRACHEPSAARETKTPFLKTRSVRVREDAAPNRRQASVRPPARAGVPAVTPQPGAPAPPAPEGMVFIEAGEFVMGSNERWDDESPEHINRTGAFFIDLYEVTNADYAEFVKATGHEPPFHWNNGKIPEGKENHPVVYVSWFDADAYCRWKGKRLPTEEEWEKAARGTDGRIYPWGNLWTLDKSNNPYKGSTGTEPVGRYPEGRSPYGVYDMSGNVWEWVDSYYLPHPGNTIPKPEYGRDKRILKGGSWFDCLSYGCGLSAPTFNRAFFNPEVKNNSFGFRCALSARPGGIRAGKP